MLLSVLLIIFITLILVISIGIFFWWRRFGKQFFEMSKNLSKMNGMMLKNPKNKDFGNFSKDFDQQMKMIQEFFKKR